MLFTNSFINKINDRQPIKANDHFKVISYYF